MRVLLSFFGLCLLFGPATSGLAQAPVSTPVEPNAGAWQTWLLSSGRQYRVAAPPDQAATAAELQTLHDMTAERDAAVLARIQYWDAGAPGYRWDQILADEFARHGLTGGTSSRQVALTELAMYDATIATWDSKYAYNRPRPVDADPSLVTAVSSPSSPSYPSEHAAVAAAAADVLGYLFPDDADVLSQKAIDAGDSRVQAGVQFPSDIAAGIQLGHQVAALAIDRAKHDGSEIPFTGTFPDQPDKWSLRGYPDGTAPIGPTFGTYKTWVLASGSELRPAPPPPAESDRAAAELTELKQIQRTFPVIAAAFFWQSQPMPYFVQLGDQRILENRLDLDPPRAAQVQALTSVAGYDAAVACWDAKYTYLKPRPFQLDPELKPLFQTPAQPSYPSAEGCVGGAELAILADLFPSDAPFFASHTQQAIDSRMWAGIHFRSDVETGLDLGRAVAQRVIDHAAINAAL